MAAKFEHARFEICERWQNDEKYKALCLVYEITNSREQKQKVERPILDINNNILHEVIDIATNNCGISHEEVEKQIQNFISSKANKPKKVIEIIENATNIEELANIWKYIHNKDNILKKRHFYLTIIQEKIKNVPLENPYFYKEKIHLEKEEAEDKFQFYLAIVDCLIEKYKNITFHEKLNLNGIYVTKEEYFKDCLETIIQIMEDLITNYTLLDSKTAGWFFYVILQFDYFIFQTPIQEKIVSIRENLKFKNSEKLDYLVDSYYLKLKKIKTILKNNIIHSYEEIAEAIEKNCALHYAVAYYNLQNITNEIEFKILEERIQYTVEYLKNNKFNENEYTLLTNLLLRENFSCKRDLEVVIIALITILENKNLDVQINPLHLHFYECISLYDLSSLDEKTKEKIIDLFNQYAVYYEQKTIQFFNHSILGDLNIKSR